MKSLGLVHALTALEPYLPDLVVCGAWAWYLYRKYLGGTARLPSNFTRDLDCIGKTRIPIRGPTLDELLKAHGFKWVPLGWDNPPAARFSWPTADHPEVEVEFLTPLRGGGSRQIVVIQDNLTAQALRDLDILLENPVQLHVEEVTEDGAQSFKGSVLVARPGHFAVQKALVHGRRSRQDQAKDLYYVFDLIDPANGLATRIKDEISAAARGNWRREVDEFVRVLSREFSSPPNVRLILDQAQPERRPSEQYVEREVHSWLERLASQWTAA